eukprot:4917627-Pleurochrysis_carterae.AAC.7
MLSLPLLLIAFTQHLEPSPSCHLLLLFKPFPPSFAQISIATFRSHNALGMADLALPRATSHTIRPGTPNFNAHAFFRHRTQGNSARLDGE